MACDVSPVAMFFFKLNYRSVLHVKKHQKNTQAKLFGKLTTLCWIWQLKINKRLFRGEIAASVGRAFLSVKLRQRIKSSPTRPEILGNNPQNVIYFISVILYRAILIPNSPRIIRQRSPKRPEFQLPSHILMSCIHLLVWTKIHLPEPEGWKIQTWHALYIKYFIAYQHF